MTEQLLTLPEVAERMGITRARVHQLVKAETLPAFRAGRFWVVKESDIAIAEKRNKKRGPKKSETNC